MAVIKGTKNSDSLTGTTADDEIWGYGGIDTLYARDGRDYVNGGAGDDRIFSYTGNARLHGGAGNDAFYLFGARDLIDGGNGIDRLTFRSSEFSLVTVDLQAGFLNSAMGRSTVMNIESVTLTNWTSKVIGNGSANDIDTGEGDDTVYGGGGNDGIDVADGNNYVHAGAGDDWISARDGSDQLFSGAGDDYVFAGGGADKLYGGAGHDRLSGEAGADLLVGGAGRDSLSGDAGNDTLIGGGGEDSFYGGRGADQMRAGLRDGEIDEFYFDNVMDSRPGTRDVIFEFERSIDAIDLYRFDADVRTADNQNFSWSGTTAAKNSLWYTRMGQDIVLKADVNGDLTADFEVLIKGISAISSEDVYL